MLVPVLAYCQNLQGFSSADVRAEKMIRSREDAGGEGVAHVGFEGEVVVAVRERADAGLLVVRPAGSAARGADEREVLPAAALRGGRLYQRPVDRLVFRVL